MLQIASTIETNNERKKLEKSFFLVDKSRVTIDKKAEGMLLRVSLGVCKVFKICDIIYKQW